MKLFIKEAVDSSIPEWLRTAIMKNKDRFTGKMPIGDATYTPLPAEGGHDVKDILRSGAANVRAGECYVFRLRNSIAYGDSGSVWIYPLMPAPVVDYRGRRKDLARASADVLDDVVTEVGVLKWDNSEYKAKLAGRKNKPYDRNAHKQFAVIKPPYRIDHSHNAPETQGPPYKSWRTDQDAPVHGSTRYDKSGYPIRGLKRYENMLSEMGFKNLIPTLADAYDTYTIFTSYAPACMGKRYRVQVFRSISNGILDFLDRIEGEYADYKNNTWDWDREFTKKHIMEYLKYLRDYQKKADKFMELIDSGVDDEREYGKLGW